MSTCVWTHLAFSVFAHVRLAGVAVVVRRTAGLDLVLVVGCRGEVHHSAIDVHFSEAA